jgi:multicomponent Na+:H+ antiporter subunit C
MITNYPYLAALALFSIGLYCILVKRDLFKMIFGICLVGYATNLFLVSLGFISGGTVPILTDTQLTTQAVDPLMQALVITAIVIEFAIVMLIVSIAIKLFERYRSTDSSVVGSSEDD